MEREREALRPGKERAELYLDLEAKITYIKINETKYRIYKKQVKTKLK